MNATRLQPQRPQPLPGAAAPSAQAAPFVASHPTDSLEAWLPFLKGGDQASRTAQAAALLRSLATPRTRKIIDDPYASRMLPPVVRTAVAAALPGLEILDKVRAAAGQRPAPNHMLMRTRAIDDAIEDAVKSGTRQVVLLGAGLDARAYRMDALKDCQVYEVDLPASQAEKREKVQDLTPKSRGHHFIPANLNEDVLKAQLQKAGFDASKPTVFVMEGLAMYLSDTSLADLFKSVDSCAGRGSEVVMTYADDAKRTAHVVGKVIGSIGEPFLSFGSPQKLSDMLGKQHFDAFSDTNDADWAKQYNVDCPQSFERLVRARKG